MVKNYEELFENVQEMFNLLQAKRLEEHNKNFYSIY